MELNLDTVLIKFTRASQYDRLVRSNAGLMMPRENPPQRSILFGSVIYYVYIQVTLLYKLDENNCCFVAVVLFTVPLDSQLFHIKLAMHVHIIFMLYGVMLLGIWIA